MRILILGGDGMLGHQLLTHFRADHNVRVTLRQKLGAYERFSLFNEQNSYDEVDAHDLDRLAWVIDDLHPQAVINGIGIVKQRFDAKELIPSIEINALFPHKLAALCERMQAGLVHVSTDCVFSGRKGNYTEQDLPDAEDLYGRTKFLGEVSKGRALTLRTSIIGLELNRKMGLLEWFLAQNGRIKGFRRAIFSGLTTAEMARVIERVFISHPGLSGLWHVASAPINKYELLRKLAAKLGRTDLQIEPDDDFVCDRSLDGGRFEQATGYCAPSWDQMLDELAQQARERGAHS